MFKRPKVSLAGRLIITSIFILTLFVPEILAMTRFSQPGIRAAISIVRIVGEVVLYYFTMLGRGWARWITAFGLIMLVAGVIAAAGRRNPPVAIATAILYIPSIAILLGLKTVQPDDRARLRRQIHS